MNKYVEQAIAIFHQEKPGLPAVGAIIAHVSDPYVYTVSDISNGIVTGTYIDEDGRQHTAQFPADEVFNPTVVKNTALRLQSEDHMEKLRPHDGNLNIIVDGRLYEL